jgi:hypothetical protein
VSRDPLVIYYFAEELQEQDLVKEAVTVGDISAGVRGAASSAARTIRAIPGFLAHEGRQFLPSAMEAASAPLKALHPSGKYLKKGWEHLSNVSPHARKAMRGAIEAGASKGHRFIDTSKGPGVLDRLRAGGWLSNVPKYVGEAGRRTGGLPADLGGGYSRVEHAKNLAMRALPGRKTLHVLPAGMGAMHTLRQKEDPETGRKIGLGERMGGAAMGAATGLVAGTATGTGIAGGMVGSHIGERLGATIGKTVGRGADVTGRGVRRLVAPRKEETKKVPLKVPR